MQETNICPVSATMELIGGKYKGLILWHLAQGTQRFSQLQKKIRSATPKMLTQQLRELESHKLIARTVYPVIPPKVEYALTDLGKTLIPLLVAMRDWGADYLRTLNLETSCFMMSQQPIPQTQTLRSNEL